MHLFFGFKMNQQIKVPGHISHLEHLNTSVVLALVVAHFVEFLAWQVLHLQLEIIIGTKKKLRR
jgi:hypothetical protein